MKVPPRLGPSDAPTRVSAPARADAAPWQRALAQHTEPDAAPRRTDTPAPETAPEDGDDGAPAATTDDAVAELAELLLPIAWPTPPEPAPVFDLRPDEGTAMGTEPLAAPEPATLADALPPVTTPEAAMAAEIGNVSTIDVPDAPTALPPPPELAVPASAATPPTPSIEPPPPAPVSEAAAPPTRMRVDDLEALSEAWTRLPTASPGEVEIDVGNLGRVHVRVEMQGDGVKLDIRTDDPRTAAFLQTRKTELLEAVTASHAGSHVHAEVHDDARGRRAPQRPDAPPPHEAAASPRRPPASPASPGRGLVDIVA